MAFTDNQKLYAMYLLGLWESSCAWDSTSYDAYINYGDAKSIGILHWTYGSAVRLCATMEAHAPNQWAALPQSWRDVASAGGDFEAVDFGPASIDRWCASVRDNYDEAVAHQTWYWMDTTEPESFEDHRSTLEGDLGPMPTQNATVIKNLIFYMRLRHNMGYYVADVFNARAVGRRLWKPCATRRSTSTVFSEITTYTARGGRTPPTTYTGSWQTGTVRARRLDSGRLTGTTAPKLRQRGGVAGRFGWHRGRW